MAKQRTFLGIKVITTAPRPNWRARLGLFLLVGALLGFVISAAGNVLMAAWGLYFNTSDSLPYGLYRAHYRSDVQVGFFALEQAGAVSRVHSWRGHVTMSTRVSAPAIRRLRASMWWLWLGIGC